MSTLFTSRSDRPPVQRVGRLTAWLYRLRGVHGRKLVIALPYLWLICLFLLPFLTVFKISFAEMARAIPPFTDLVTWPTINWILRLTLLTIFSCSTIHCMWMPIFSRCR